MSKHFFNPYPDDDREGRLEALRRRRDKRHGKRFRDGEFLSVPTDVLEDGLNLIETVISVSGDNPALRKIYEDLWAWAAWSEDRRGNAPTQGEWREGDN